MKRCELLERSRNFHRLSSVRILAACCVWTWGVFGPGLGAEESASREPTDLATMMELVARAATPGPPHQMLAETVGEWELELKAWHDPNQPPLVSPGRSIRRLILGGRVMVEEVESNFGGQPFEGFGMVGYDNVKGSYWATWNDSASTGLAISYGDYDAANRTMTLQGEYWNPVVGGRVETKTVILNQPNRQVMEAWDFKNGKLVKVMEIIYSRKPTEP